MYVDSPVVEQAIFFSYPVFCWSLILQESKISVGVRSIFCIVEKAEAKWWNKLVRDDQKAPHFVKVDWDKWVDEDDDGMLSTKTG